jgi:GNAT superfamily N-acetyltransferase
MTGISIMEITKEDASRLKEISKLLKKMYHEMSATGLILQLQENGEETWLNSIRPGLGRFSILIAATVDGRVVGFAHGAMHYTPEYLGSLKVGTITHIFVEPEFRRAGTAGKLVSLLEKWFAERQVHSVELQVLSGNEDAVRFWESAGFSCELRQYRKIF